MLDGMRLAKRGLQALEQELAEKTEENYELRASSTDLADRLASEENARLRLEVELIRVRKALDEERARGDREEVRADREAETVDWERQQRREEKAARQRAERERDAAEATQVQLVEEMALVKRAAEAERNEQQRRIDELTCENAGQRLELEAWEEGVHLKQRQDR
jgi:hypothetical protein